MKYEHLLIDAKNMLYRATYTALGDRRFKDSGHHPINIVLHFMHYYLDKFNPTNIHVFWDTRRDKTWRKAVLPNYKENRVDSPQRSDGDVDGTIVSLTESCTALFKDMSIRQYYKEGMEADDLIYAFCRTNRSSRIIIISSDGDLKQIPFNYQNVDIHHPLNKKGSLIEDRPTTDPVMYKALRGDRSDNIDGYHGVGDIKATLLAEDVRARQLFFESPKAIIKDGDERPVVGSKRFEENLRIIDLSMCPGLAENMTYIMRKQFKPVQFNLDNIRETISKYKLRGVTADLSRYVIPFKKLAETEVTNGS